MYSDMTYATGLNGIYVHYHMWQFSSLICLKYEVGNIFTIPTI